MPSRALLPLLGTLLFAACFDDSRGDDTGSTAAATLMTTSATQVSGDVTTTTTTSTSTTDWTSGEPTTSTSTGGVDPVTGTTDPTTGTSTTGGDTNVGCQMYCAAMMGSCTGTNAQYPSNESCLGACGGLPPGSPGETSGNSLSCRAYHAGMASIDPGVHCIHAGPSGAGACGQSCEGFCAIATSICPTEHPSPADCMATCANFMDTEPYNTEDAAGNTLACRLYHLTIAATGPAEAQVHCGHTIEASPPCM
ncbi:hypothetical protein SAMN02745121_06967 [Nannocystis exedens]|uniref:Uncharacterized protein n=1 Tax=Nannocystis exedens TaxID=54 RepID=A0A1I2G0S4_9BACT|nr:hypothetical protein [Nannocystis exedens]PCC74601.1 hypothetical protein NAEX_07698 [Nannocystis exedens]SFF10773.1 hypothetical protein SAMN02745121_06967 [Nannocystis exedens]